LSSYILLDCLVFRQGEVYGVELSHSDPSSHAQVAAVRDATALDLSALRDLLLDPEGSGPGRNPLWLKIEEITGTEIKGTFSADLWAGPFHGKDCGRWILGNDTGQDSGF